MIYIIKLIKYNKIHPRYHCFMNSDECIVTSTCVPMATIKTGRVPSPQKFPCDPSVANPSSCP